MTITFPHHIWVSLGTRLTFRSPWLPVLKGLINLMLTRLGRESVRWELWSPSGGYSSHLEPLLCPSITPRVLHSPPAVVGRLVLVIEETINEPELVWGLVHDAENEDKSTRGSLVMLASGMMQDQDFWLVENCAWSLDPFEAFDHLIYRVQRTNMVAIIDLLKFRGHIDHFNPRSWNLVPQLRGKVAHGLHGSCTVEWACA